MSLTLKIKTLTLTYEDDRKTFYTVEDADVQVLRWAHEWVDNDLVEIDCLIDFTNGVTAHGDIVLQKELVYHHAGFLRAVSAMADLAEHVRDYPKRPERWKRKTTPRNSIMERIKQFDNYESN
jgi:hypothetical protein